MEQLAETIETVNSDALYLADKATVDVQVSTARAYPRNIHKSINNAIAIVTMDKETAQSCTYSLPRGGKAITGPSVHLAKILVQYWGNTRIEAKVIGVDAKHVTSEATCWDLENNVAIKTQVKRSIMTKNGRMSDDMITVTGNAANAIALRNAVFAVIPRGAVDKVYTSAIKFITGDLTDETKLMAKRKAVLDGFKDTYGVSEVEVLNSIGKSSIDHIKADEIAILIGVAQAIKDGDTTPDEAFRSIKKTPKSVDEVSREKESQRILDHIKYAKTIPQLNEALSIMTTDEQREAFDAKLVELSPKSKANV
jgi:hypothetical protein